MKQKLTWIDYVQIFIAVALVMYGFAALGATIASGQIMNQDREAAYLQLLPEITDEFANERIRDPDALVYTDKEMPPAFQHHGRIHYGLHNFSGDRSEPHGNANSDFPWRRPGGTHSAKVHTFRILSLPKSANGVRWPVVYYRGTKPSNRYRPQSGYKWRFPVGTVIFEVLMQRSSDGDSYPFEIRMRQRTADSWEPEVFRPFPEARDLVNRILELDPDAENVQQIVDSPSFLLRSLHDGHHKNRVVINQSGVVQRIPPMNEMLVKRLLWQTPFEPVSGSTFADMSGTKQAVYGMTSDSNFNVVPAKYKGGLIEVRRESCMRCHETIGRHAIEFQNPRDWYGYVRGSDGIFSFHPYDPLIIHYDGGAAEHPVQIRRSLIAAGVLAAYDAGKHPDSIYSRIRGLE